MDMTEPRACGGVQDLAAALLMILDPIGILLLEVDLFLAAAILLGVAIFLEADILLEVALACPDMNRRRC